MRGFSQATAGNSGATSFIERTHLARFLFWECLRFTCPQKRLQKYIQYNWFIIVIHSLIKLRSFISVYRTLDQTWLYLLLKVTKWSLWPMHSYLSADQWYQNQNHNRTEVQIHMGWAWLACNSCVWNDWPVMVQGSQEHSNHPDGGRTYRKPCRWPWRTAHAACTRDRTQKMRRYIYIYNKHIIL